MVVLIVRLIISRLNHRYWEQCAFKHLFEKIANISSPMSDFHSLEVVGRGSETQLQVGEKLKFYNVALKIPRQCQLQINDKCQ